MLRYVFFQWVVFKNLYMFCVFCLSFAFTGFFYGFSWNPGVLGPGEMKLCTSLGDSDG